MQPDAVPDNYSRLFKSQFSNPELLSVNHVVEASDSMAKVVDINPNSEGPIRLLVPGFLSNNESQKQVLKTLGKDGNRIISLEYICGETDDNNKGEFSRILEQPAEIISAIIDYKDLKDVHVIAHSAGFIHAVLASSRDDMEAIRSITAISPAGITGVESEISARTIERYVMGSLELMTQGNFLRVVSSTLNRVRKSRSSTLVEASEIDRAYVLDVVEKVINKIPITLLMQQADELFRPKAYVEALAGAGWPSKNEKLGKLSVATVLGMRVPHSGYLSRNAVIRAVDQVVETHISIGYLPEAA